MPDLHGFDVGEQAADAAVTRRETSAHQEWLLDEALKETFPASDPISPARPAGEPRRRAEPAKGVADGGGPPQRQRPS